VVLTVYGEQQGARLGYNPKKRGRRSYHPLLCFESNAGVLARLLPTGNAVAHTGAVRFMERCLARSFHRGAQSCAGASDSGFYNGKLLGMLENKGCGYAVVANNSPRSGAGRRPGSSKLQHGWEVAEFSYKAHGCQGPAFCSYSPTIPKTRSKLSN